MKVAVGISATLWQDREKGLSTFRALSGQEAAKEPEHGGGSPEIKDEENEQTERGTGEAEQIFHGILLNKDHCGKYAYWAQRHSRH